MRRTLNIKRLLIFLTVLGLILIIWVIKVENDVYLEIGGQQLNKESFKSIMSNISLNNGTYSNSNDLNNINEIINKSTGNKKAYLLMLTSENNDKPDIYYASISAVIYKLLYNPITKTKLDDVDVVVMVTENVANWKIINLHKLGATIKMVYNIEIKGRKYKNSRWRNCFSKLYMFCLTEYETIVYLDADLLLLKNIDDLFSMAEKERERTQRKDFFGAVIDGGYAKYRKGEKEKKMFNAGLMIITPEKKVFEDLMSIAPHTNLYNIRFMEQGLLNYYYSEDNIFGRVRYHIPIEYNAQWINKDQTEFMDEIKMVHQKLWKNEECRNNEVQHLILDEIIEWVTFYKTQISNQSIITNIN